MFIIWRCQCLFLRFQGGLKAELYSLYCTMPSGKVDEPKKKWRKQQDKPHKSKFLDYCLADLGNEQTLKHLSSCALSTYQKRIAAMLTYYSIDQNSEQQFRVRSKIPTHWNTLQESPLRQDCISRRLPGTYVFPSTRLSNLRSTKIIIRTSLALRTLSR